MTDFGTPDSSVVRDGLIYIPPTVASTTRDGSGSPDSYDRSRLLNVLDAPTNKKALPTTLLYDERGLELYDDITTHAGDHYYLFPAEEHILKTRAKDVIDVMCAGDEAWKKSVSQVDGVSGTLPPPVMLELGAGYVLLVVSCIRRTLEE